MTHPPAGEPEYRDALVHGPARGRAAGLNPGNRFEAIRLHVLGDYLDDQIRLQTDQPSEPGTDRADQPQSPSPQDAQPQVATKVYRDRTRSLLNQVNSPDVPFGWSINPYRGCEHGCIYCYARPDHERLGFSSGLDFETRILAKSDAASILRRELAKPKWQPVTVVMAGDTDCYQPVERKLGITRQILEVFAECRHPVSIVTKNRLVLRDLDLLQELARFNAVRVAISVTTLDASLAGKLEPRASSPADRLRTIRELSQSGIETVVMCAPVIPGLTDKEVPAILAAGAGAGASHAGYVLLRLPYQIKALFLDWLSRHMPDRAKHIESLLRQCHDGELYDARFGKRKRGEGAIARQIHQSFVVFARRQGLNRDWASLNTQAFVRPMRQTPGQMNLFSS